MPNRRERRAATQILSGKRLLEAIAVTAQSIRWLAHDGKILGKLAPAQAKVIAASGLYVGKCEPRRVHYIQEQVIVVPDPRPCFVDDPYHDGYYVGEGEPMIPAIPITSKTVDLWDEHFNREQQALNHRTS